MGEDTLTASASPPLRGRFDVPGDKSISHRALILGALASGDTRIHGLLESLDVLATGDAVVAFGADVERDGGSWSVRGCQWRSPAGSIDCGNSGTSARLLMGAASAFPIEATFTGDGSLSTRPMNRVLDPLRQMGVDASAQAGGKLPVIIRGGHLGGIHYRNDIGSAQVKSAILLAGLGTEEDVTIVEPIPSRDHSERMLARFGCDIVFEGGEVRLGSHRRLAGTEVIVPGDPSSAAFPLVASLLVPGSELILPNVMINPLRTGLLTTLLEMGANLRLENRRDQSGEEVADLQVSHSALTGVEVPAARAPSMIDEYPILAVAAACAQGRTVMRGLSELRVKESDRLRAIVEGLASCGADAWVDGDDLVVEGKGAPPIGGAQIGAAGDHRIAMSFLVLGLATHNAVMVDSAGSIATSFPNFAADMRRIGAAIA